MSGLLKNLRCLRNIMGFQYIFRNFKYFQEFSVFRKRISGVFRNFLKFSEVLRFLKISRIFQDLFFNIRTL
jgi:hypothetical protein